MKPMGLVRAPPPVLRRILSFAGLPLLSLLTPFLLLPLVARIGGPDSWVAINVGQSIGALGAVVGGLGWPLTGSAEVAAADDRRRAELYAASLSARLVSTSTSIVVAAVVSFLVSPPDERLVGALMAAAIACGGLLPTWYSIGIGSAAAIALYETVPRLVASAVSAALILATGAIWVYPVLLLVVTLVGTAAFGSRVVGFRLAQVARSNPFAIIWSTRTPTTTMLTSASYALAPVPLAAAVGGTGAAASFSSADRLFRLALLAVQVFVNAFQNWIVDGRQAGGQVDERRARRAVCTIVSVGLGGAVLLAVLGQSISELLFGAAVAAGPVIGVLYAVALAAIAGSTATGRMILIPAGRTRAVFRSTVVGAAVGLPLMLVLGTPLGTVGVAIGFAVSEMAVLILQMVVVVRMRRRSR